MTECEEQWYESKEEFLEDYLGCDDNWTLDDSYDPD